MTQPKALNAEGKCVYPSDVEIGTWFQLSTCAHHIEEEGGHISKRARFIAQKACDWQREQDALICEVEAEFLKSDQDGASGACRICADSIRHQEAKSND